MIQKQKQLLEILTAKIHPNPGDSESPEMITLPATVIDLGQLVGDDLETEVKDALVSEIDNANVVISNIQIDEDNFEGTADVSVTDTNLYQLNVNTITFTYSV